MEMNADSMFWPIIPLAWSYKPATLSVLCVALVAIVTSIFRIVRYRQGVKKLVSYPSRSLAACDSDI
jgi:hypothetical protein